MKINFKNKKNKGFTLVETMIAVFILTLGITSVLSVIGGSFFSARYAKNELTGTYLNQEAIDYVRNSRDTLAFQNGDWTSFLKKFGYDDTKSGGDDLCFKSPGCSFDVTDNVGTYLKYCNNVAFWGSLPCPELYINSSPTSGLGGYYTYDQNISGAIPAKMKRMIFMQLNSNNSSGYEVDITVTSEWLNGNVVRSQTLRESLLKWQ